MSRQTQLPYTTPPIKGDRIEPRMWVKEFVFYSEFKPDKEVRHLTLRRGLNIIWAKESETGASGHAAGKSTFCRLLRYLIGDTHFGSESFRPAFRDTFPNAVIAGEVILSGVPWLLCRPLSTHGYHWCAPSHQLGELFDENIGKKDFAQFIDALNDTYIAPLGIATYPGSDRIPEWQHLLQWLGRDQDARYADPLQWRAGAESGVPLNHEKTNLIRLLLGHLGPDELVKQQEHSVSLKERNDIKTLLPKLQFARDRVVTSLSRIFPDLARKNFDLESKLDEYVLQLTRERDALLEKRKLLNSHDGVGEVLTAKLELAREKKSGLQRRTDTQVNEIKRRRIQLSYRRKELSKEEYNRQLATLGDIEGKCSALIDLAHEVNCPLAPPRDRDELQLARLEQVSATAERLGNFIETLVPQLERLNSELKNAEDEYKTVSGLVEKRQLDHRQARITTGEKLQEANTSLASLCSALADTVQIRESREKQGKLDEKIDASSNELAALRKRSTQLLSTLSDDFSHVASHLTESEIHGSVAFHSDAIATSLHYDGDMSSTALITLKLLTFDLACLLGSVRTTSNHPGFLLHDSPREADLSPSIYRRFFTLIAGEEENEAVQYIIATTEAPPVKLQQRPWLVCEPLSSETPHQRFLRAII